MNAKNVLDTLLEQEEMTRYRLAKRLGIHESLLSRAYNGESDPGFNEVSRWLDELGYSFVIMPVASTPLEDDRAYDINSFGRKLSEINRDSYDYLEVHRYLKQVLEGLSSSRNPPSVFYYPKSMQNKNWRAFYAATIAHIFKQQQRRVPRYAAIISNRLDHAWSPIKKLGKAHTEFDETYLEYNVLLPKGELTWI